MAKERQNEAAEAHARAPRPRPVMGPAQERSEPLLRDVRKAQTRRALIEHAVLLFDEVGFEATTVDDIVRAAGCSQRSFFRHFSSKEDVVFHDLPERLVALRTVLEQAPHDAKAWPVVRDTMQQMTHEMTDEDPRLAQARIRLWMTEPRLYARWSELSLEWEQVIADFLVARRPDPVESEIEAEVIAAAVVAALRAAWRNEVLHGGRFDDLVGSALRLIERGLASDGAI